MNKEICHIVGASEYCKTSFTPQKGDFVIAVDGGFNILTVLNITPDIIIGDFDSLNHIPSGAIRLNKQKNDTDTLAAIKLGIERGYKIFYLHACMGGRLSHTIANIQCLEFLTRQGLCGYIFDGNTTATVIRKGEHTFVNSGGYFSVFALDNNVIVTLEGVKYPLNNYKMTRTFPIGVSNEIISSTAKVTLSSGNLLVIFNEK